jgi:hypothetical protein
MSLVRVPLSTFEEWNNDERHRVSIPRLNPMSDSRKRKRRVKPQLISAPAGETQPSMPDPPSQTLKQQRWTELTAVSHVLADEILLHQEQNRSTLSHGELRQLRSWSNSVQNRIYQQTTCVLENVALATEMRRKQREVELTRDDLMVLRTQTKQFRDEALRLGEDTEKAEKESSTVRSASQFLTALQTLAETGRRVK